MANWEFTKQLSTSLIRMGLAGFGAWLVKRGLVDAATENQWLSEVSLAGAGLITIGLTTAWQYLKTRYNVLALTKAVQTSPPADTPKEVAAAVEQVKKEVKAENAAVVAY